MSNFTRLQPSKASIRAVLINRVGDFGLSLGIMAIFSVFKGKRRFCNCFYLHFADTLFIFCNIECGLLNLVCIFLFIGAVGKSAQLGLHTWLPDAMEDPTPVFALIRAATYPFYPFYLFYLFYLFYPLLGPLRRCFEAIT